MDLKFRRLRNDEIELRPQTINSNGCSLLLYKDARVDMNILDETVGNTNWTRNHEFKDNKLYCTVSIWDDDKKMFVSKEDVGVESNTEAEKGQASDSFKRACFNWGIGRELYTSPFVWIKLVENESEQKGKGYVLKVKFAVSQISYDDNGNISLLEIKDDKGNVRFSTVKSKKEEKPSLADKVAEYYKKGGSYKTCIEEHNAIVGSKFKDQTLEQKAELLDKLKKLEELGQ